MAHTTLSQVLVENKKLRTGPVSQIANQPLVTAQGVQVRVGQLGPKVFSETPRFEIAFQRARQQANIVAGDLSFEEYFEEYTDRLVLIRECRFNVLDGVAFAALVPKALEPPGQISRTNAFPAIDMRALAADFIKRGAHLTNSAEVAAAGKQGVGALLTEMRKDRGLVKVRETVTYGKLIKPLRTLRDAAGTSLLLTSDAGLARITAEDLEQNAHLFRVANSSAPVITLPGPPVTAGVGSYQQEMLNGFTLGAFFEKTVSFSTWYCELEAGAYAGLGLGVRIPWEARVEVGSRVIQESATNHTPFQAAVRVETLDGDSAFYRRVGLPDEQVFSGKELVIYAGAGVTLRLVVLDSTLIDRPRSNPLVGREIDMGRDFDPPMSNDTLNLARLVLNYEDSGLKYGNRFVAIGADLAAEATASSHGLELQAAPHNSFLVVNDRYQTTDATLSFATEGEESLQFAIDDDATAERDGTGGRFYRHGLVLRDARYRPTLRITPEARVRGTVFLAEVSSLLDNFSLSSGWVSLATFDFDLPELEPHEDTESIIAAYDLQRRLLPDRVLDVTRSLQQLSENRWQINVAITGGANGGPVSIVESLRPGWTAETIGGGGIFDTVARTIIWSQLTPASNTMLTYVAVDSARAGLPPAVQGRATLGAATTQIADAHLATGIASVTPPTVAGRLFWGLIIHGKSGATYTIEASDALDAAADWTPVQSIVLPYSPYVWIEQDSIELRSHRFYRAVISP